MACRAAARTHSPSLVGDRGVERPLLERFVREGADAGENAGVGENEFELHEGNASKYECRIAEGRMNGECR